MRTLIIGLVAASAALGGCTEYGNDRGVDRRFNGYSNYDYDRPDPSITAMMLIGIVSQTIRLMGAIRVGNVHGVSDL